MGTCVGDKANIELLYKNTGARLVLDDCSFPQRCDGLLAKAMIGHYLSCDNFRELFLMDYADFPPKCPPERAEPASGSIFRLVSRATMKPKDFLSYKELNPHKNYEGKECQSCGLSVFRTQEDCSKAKATIPALRKKHVAAADLRDPVGLYAATPSYNTGNHHTWWIPGTSSRVIDFFEVIS